MAKHFAGLVVSILVCFLAGFQSASAQTTYGIPVELTIPSTTLTVVGVTSPGSLITIQENSNTIGTATSNAVGEFTILLSSQSVGIRTISGFFTDPEGNKSAAITKQISVQSQSDTLVEMLFGPTLARRTANEVKKGSVSQFSGYTAPNAVIELKIVGPINKSVFVDSGSDGFYEFILKTENLESGSYIFTTKTKLADLRVSGESEKVFMTILSDKSSAIASPDLVVSPDQLPPPVTHSPDDNAVIEGNSTIITGESVPNAQINIYESGEVIGSVFADASGRWSFNYVATSSPVTLSFEACIDGICSVLSKSITVYFNNLNGFCNLDFQLLKYRFFDVSVREKISLDTISEQEKGTVQIDWGDGTIEKFNYDKESNNQFVKYYENKGNYNGKITFFPDSSRDCHVERYFSILVSEDDTKEDANAFFWILILIACLLALNYISSKEKQSTIQDK